MPKTSVKQIDIDEKKIIRELQKNSKESIDKIAKKCGFSRQKVWRIIKRLEKNKTILGYHAVVDEQKLGLKKFLVLIKRANEPLKEEHIDIVIKRKLKPEIAKIGVDIDCSYFVHGSYDWFISIIASDIKQVKKFTEIFYKLSEKHVSDIQILDVVFPVETCGFDNPNLKKIREFF